MAFLAIFFLLFASVMLANYLNLVLDSSFWGYGIVAAVYLIFAGIIFTLKDKNFIYKRTREYANWIVKDPDRDIDYGEDHR